MEKERKTYLMTVDEEEENKKSSRRKDFFFLHFISLSKVVCLDWEKSKQKLDERKVSHKQKCRRVHISLIGNEY